MNGTLMERRHEMCMRKEFVKCYRNAERELLTKCVQRKIELQNVIKNKEQGRMKEKALHGFD